MRMPRGTALKWIRNTLAVIVAVAVVVQVAAYAVRHSRDVSMQRTCAGNLKLLGQACEMYQHDWHDVLVPFGAPFGFPPNKMWYELLDPYRKRMEGNQMVTSSSFAKIYKCSAEPDDGCFCYHRSYGMNQRCGGWYPKGTSYPHAKLVVVRLESVKYPEGTIRIAETEWEDVGGTAFAARPSQFNPDDLHGHRFPTWHMGKGNVLWIDGHVSAMTRDQYNMRDKGPDDGNIWLRLEGPKPPLPR